MTDVRSAGGHDAAPRAGWRRERIRFRYRCGALPLPAVPLVAWVDDEHFSRRGAAAPADAPPPLGAGVDVRLRQSLPVQADPPLIALRGGTVQYAAECYWRHYVDLEGSFESYWQRALSPKSRSTVGRKVRRFTAESGGALDWREFRRPDEMAELYALARRISIHTYQEQVYDAGLPIAAAFADRLRARAERDEVRGYVLWLAGRPIAYLLCLADGDVLFAQYLGYDPALRQWSPGTVLQYVALRRLFEEGRFRLFDFTKGDGQHKAVFATGAVRCADLYEFRPTPTGVLLVATHAGCTRAGRLAGALLERLGLKSRLRRWIRAALSREDRRTAPCERFGDAEVSSPE